MKKYSKYTNILTREFLIEEYTINKRSSVEISKKLGCSPVTILNYLKYYNISIEPLGSFIVGKKRPDHSKRMNGSGNPIFGKPRSKKTKKKISITKKKQLSIPENNGSFKHGKYSKNIKYYCIDGCGKELSSGIHKRCTKCQGKNHSKMHKGIKRPEAGRSGSDNGNWKGGITNLNLWIRVLPEYISWRDLVFKRDDFRCQECGDSSGGNLEAHHNIKSFSIILSEFLNVYSQFSPLEDTETLVRLASKYLPFWDINNGQTLCKKCHKLTNNYGGRIFKKEVKIL